jgi:hypothetical protein
MAGRKYTRRAPRPSRGQRDAPARPEARPRRQGARPCGSKQRGALRPLSCPSWRDSWALTWTHPRMQGVKTSSSPAGLSAPNPFRYLPSSPRASCPLFSQSQRQRTSVAVLHPAFECSHFVGCWPWWNLQEDASSHRRATLLGAQSNIQAHVFRGPTAAPPLRMNGTTLLAANSHFNYISSGWRPREAHLQGSARSTERPFGISRGRQSHADVAGISSNP